MFGAIALIIAVYLAFRVKSLEKQLDQLTSSFHVDKKHVQMSQTEVSSQAPVEKGRAATNAVGQVPGSVSESQPQPYIPQAPAVHSEPTAFDQFWTWMQDDFLVKLGALLLLLGFGWFVSYAFANDWIGPMGRIALGFFAGALILVLGQWRIRRYVHQGGIFIALGSTVILLTTWAAREVYEMFTPAAALVVMFLSVVFVAFASVQHKRKYLALVSLVLAGMAPLLTNTADPSVFGLFSYLLVVALGTLWVVYLTGWRELTFAALVLVFLYGLPFLSLRLGAPEQEVALLFAFIFTSIFFVVNTLSITHHRSGELHRAHLITAFGTGFYVILWITTAVSEEWRSLLYIAWLLVFALGAFVVFRTTRMHAPFYVYAGVGVALLGTALTAELQGPALTIGYTLEAGLVVALAASLIRDVTVVRKLAWLFVIPVIMSVSSITSSTWRDGFLHDDFFALIVLALTLAVCGTYLFEKARDEDTKLTAGAFIFTASAYVLGLIWLVLHAVFVMDFATMVALTIYTVTGVSLYVIGRSTDKKLLRVGGAVLIGIVIGRLLLVEIWTMELTGRIITFFIIGTLLVSTAFIGRGRPSEHLVAEDTNRHSS